MIREHSVDAESQSETPAAHPAPVATQESDSSLQIPAAAIPCAIVAAAFVVYARSLFFGFVYDDRGQIVTDQLIRTWRSLPFIFTHHVWSFNAGPPANYYRPLFMVWFLANHSLFGLNPFWWHLSTVCVHCAAAALVYLFWLKLTGDKWTAAIAGLIFAVHPVHVESVAWVSGVTDPMATVFSLLAFMCYMKASPPAPPDPAKRPRWIGGAVALFGIALLTKETAIALIAVLAVYEWLYRGTVDEGLFERARRIIQSLWAFIALTVLYIGVRTAVLKGLAHRFAEISLSTIIWTWPHLIWFYIKLLVAPAGLSVFYDTRFVTSFSIIWVVLPTVGLLVLAFLMIVWARRLDDRQRKSVVVAVSLMILPMLPLFDLSLFAEADIVHDRYLYIPSIGFALLLAVAIRQMGRAIKRVRTSAIIQAACCLVLTSLLAGAAIRQCGYWRDDLALYSRGVEVSPKNIMARLNLGVALSERGRLSEGVAAFEQVLKIEPQNWMALSDAGYNYYQLGDLARADRYLTQAISVDVYNPSPYLCLGLTRAEMGKTADARSLLERAIQLKPSGDGFHEALGMVFQQEGDRAHAIEEYKEELRYNPGRQSARQRLAEIESQRESAKPR